MDALTALIKKYEDATNSHDFDQVAQLVAENAVYWFSDGSYQGISAIRTAFESAWGTVRDEVYTISNIRWPAISDSAAVCVYDFSWRGTITASRNPAAGEARTF